jgi:hypothetical protein
MALSLQRRNRLGENVRQIRLFAKYSIPLVWGIVGLVVGCVGAYFVLAFVWTHAIMRPEAVTPEDGLTVIILSLVFSPAPPPCMLPRKRGGTQRNKAIQVPFAPGR